jgi:hypothetical protein
MRHESGEFRKSLYCRHDSPESAKRFHAQQRYDSYNIVSYSKDSGKRDPIEPDIGFSVLDQLVSKGGGRHGVVVERPSKRSFSQATRKKKNENARNRDRIS